MCLIYSLLGLNPSFAVGNTLFKHHSSVRVHTTPAVHSRCNLLLMHHLSSSCKCCQQPKLLDTKPRDFCDLPTENQLIFPQKITDYSTVVARSQCANRLTDGDTTIQDKLFAALFQSNK